VNGALSDLTDKEKDALRLLLAGHDAKSSANELGISVHALNDRLRGARRKLGVSSSREAARILGETESEAPQNLAHTDSGMSAGPASHDIAVLDETRRAGLSRAAWLTGGMLIMSIAIAAAAIFLLADGPAEPARIAEAESTAQDRGSANPVDRADAVSIERAEAFLARIDAGDWEGSWELTGTPIRSEISPREWQEQVAPVRAPLGRVLSREVATIERASSLPGAAEGDYQVMQFRTRFENEEGHSVETIVMKMGPQGWEISGYFIA